MVNNGYSPGTKCLLVFDVGNYGEDNSMNSLHFIDLSLSVIKFICHMFSDITRTTPLSDKYYSILIQPSFLVRKEKIYQSGS
jgi:hypothetical protein